MSYRQTTQSRESRCSGGVLHFHELSICLMAALCFMAMIRDYLSLDPPLGRPVLQELQHCEKQEGFIIEIICLKQESMTLDHSVCMKQLFPSRMITSLGVFVSTEAKEDF